MAANSRFQHFSPLALWCKEWGRRLKFAHIWNWWSFGLLVLMLTWLMGVSIGSIPEDAREGAIAPYDIRADREYRLLDDAATKVAREEAVKGVLPVHDYYTGMGAATAERIRSAFDAARKAYHEAMQRTLASETGKKRAPTIGADLSATLQTKWEEVAAMKLTEVQWKALVNEEWGFGAQELVVGQIAYAMNRPLVAEPEAFLAHKERGVTVRRMLRPDATGEIQEVVWHGKEINDARAIETVRKAMRGRVGKERLRHPTNAEPLVSIAAAAIQSNCVPNVLETEVRRSNAMREVPSRHRLVQAGEIIVRRGEPYSLEHLFWLEGIRKQKATGALPLKFVGNYLFIAVLLLLLHFFGKRYIRKYAPTRQDRLFLGAFLVVMIALLRAGGILSEVLADALPFSIPRFAYFYLMPLAAGGMMARFLLNSETAMLFGAALAAMAGLLFPQDPSFSAYALTTTLAGAHFIAHADKRSAIIRAGLRTGLVSAFAVVGIQLMRAGAMTEMLTLHQLCWYVAVAFASGIFSAIIVLTLTPVGESVFGYTTDIKLLELANLNHPLLRELIIRAPGTYHHSHLVGILAESAAQVIGANPLLARVAAYYHDIGKMRKPLYFTENLKEGESRHSRLTPHMSALIIGSHIKDGLELARLHKLPERIVEMIPQHHGTNRIGYFYERAKEAADPTHTPIDEKDFRYPGPKPQSREAGILLLADQTEGAVRALKEKSPARVQQTVEQIMNKSFAEGQLDECELTLKNLNEIANAFTRILLAIYHQRIEYPKETLKLHEKDIQLLEESAPRHAESGGPVAKTPPLLRH